MRLPARFPHAAVASPHYLASAAGLAALARGGNALDAAIAANLALGVVAPYFCGPGGDVFAIVWDGDLHGYLGSGRSPASDTLAGLRERVAGEHMPVFGAHTVTVPGAVAGWFDLLERFGTREFGDLARDAIRLARDGFEVTWAGAIPFAEARRMYGDFPEWMTAYGHVEAGTRLVQPALARTLETIARDGPDVFYRGSIADSITASVGEGGGVLDAADLAAHRGEWTAPLVAPYRDIDVAELPPPTQGVTVLETLRILDALDLPAPGPGREHVLVEALKCALADRDRWVGDPATMERPVADLLGEDWTKAHAAAIDEARAGAPPAGLPHAGDTAYLCAADADGLLVSLIQSNFVHFGSGVHVPEWGVNLNNRGFSFSLDAEAVNAYGAAKRPLHTLIPALALRDRSPSLVFGSMGGDAQAAVHVQVLAHVIDDGWDPADAIAAPRWRVDPGVWRVRAESRFDPSVLDGLRGRGHDVIEAPAYDPGMGHAHAVWPTATGSWGATHDPRSEGAALGL